MKLSWMLVLAASAGLAGCSQAIEQAEVIFKGADPTSETGAPPVATTPDQPAAVAAAPLPPLQNPEAAAAPPIETGGVGRGRDEDEFANYEPDRFHTVAQGETVYSIARGYGTTPSAIRLANGLGDSFAIRPGQVLSIPRGRAPLPPSAGDPTPPPPAEARDLASPQLSQYRSDTVRRRLFRPVPGDIVSTFGAVDASGPRTGVELRALPGVPVKAADDGEVMFVSSDDSPLGQMLLLKHENGLLSVYGNLANVAVAQGEAIGRGATLAEVAEPPAGREPTVMFELRRGATPIDPTPYL